MQLEGILANNIHWLREFQLSTVGVSYPALASFSGWRQSARSWEGSQWAWRGLTHLHSLVCRDYMHKYIICTCVQSAYLLLLFHQLLATTATVKSLVMYSFRPMFGPPQLCRTAKILHKKWSLIMWKSVRTNRYCHPTLLQPWLSDGAV